MEGPLTTDRHAVRTRPGAVRGGELPQGRLAWSPHALPRTRKLPGPPPALVLGLGGVLAPALGLLPLLQYVGWFLASLVHEIGHCVVAWVFGAPAYPAIRLDGHAAAVHGSQHVILLVFFWCLLAAWGWSVRRRPRLRIVAGCALVLHPVLASCQAHEILHLLAGHAAEVAFAALALHRAWSGGFTESLAERVTYAMVGWYLLGKNVVLDVGLITSESARSAYLGNGSFGLEQDFMRAARALDWSLAGVGGLMLLLALTVLPGLFWLWSRAPAPRDSTPSPAR